MKTSQEGLLVKVQPSEAGEHSILEIPVPWDDSHQEQQQQWSGASPSLEYELCVLQKAKLER